MWTRRTAFQSLAIAPLMVLALVVIAMPAARIERRFSNAMYELQEHTAPAQLRMDALTNMQAWGPAMRFRDQGLRLQCKAESNGPAKSIGYLTAMPVALDGQLFAALTGPSIVKIHL